MFLDRRRGAPTNVEDKPRVPRTREEQEQLAFVLCETGFADVAPQRRERTERRLPELDPCGRRGLRMRVGLGGA